MPFVGSGRGRMKATIARNGEAGTRIKIGAVSRNFSGPNSVSGRLIGGRKGQVMAPIFQVFVLLAHYRIQREYNRKR